jgi:MOSC domain-containing protein YiiM
MPDAGSAPPRVLQVRVGLPRDIAAGEDGRGWTTGSFKEPVARSLWLGPTNLAGDGQADLKNHGGPDKALCVYPADHYPAWRAELGKPDFPFGAFGENLVLAGVTEETVCIGDVFRLGGATVQVSQPRQPCWKLSRRWGVGDLALRVQQSGRTGWYLRVVEQGDVAPGQPLLLLDRPLPAWSVARANAAMHDRATPRPLLAELASCPELSARWRATLAARAGGDEATDPRARLQGR